MVLGRLRASLERSWICGFTQDCKAALPRPSPPPARTRLLGFSLLIVKIDLRGSASGSGPPRSTPPKVATLRTA